MFVALCYKTHTMRLDPTWIDGARRDAAYAVRALAKSRGFTAAAVLTLAIGIGATTAICSIVSTVLLAPLPLTEGDRLVRIVENDRPRNLPGMSYREYLEWQPRTTTLSSLAAAGSHPQIVAIASSPTTSIMRTRVSRCVAGAPREPSASS